MNEIRPIQWTDGRLWLLDQTRLPLEEVNLEVSRYDQAIDAIREMRVRGAPAIGVTAGYAMAMAAQELDEPTGQAIWRNLRLPPFELARPVPPAVNLQWAVQRMLRLAQDEQDVENIPGRLLAEARKIHTDDEEINRRMGDLGKNLFPTAAQY